MSDSTNDMNIVSWASSESNQSSFQDVPFNEIDGLIFSQLSNQDFSGLGLDINSGGSVTLGEIRSTLLERATGDDRALMEAICNNPRYQDVVISNFVKNPAANGAAGFEKTSIGIPEHEQFSGVTITIKGSTPSEDFNFLGFQATNGTDAGWAEDADMLTYTETQAQKDSVTYMNQVVPGLTGTIAGGGHSKGGNDFQYGYLFCDPEVADRISGGYCYDSPGLSEQTLSLTDRNAAFQKLIHSPNGVFLAPQDTFVSQLLTENEDPTIIYSNAKDKLHEHDPYSWVIQENDGVPSFVPAEQTELSKMANRVLDDAIALMPEDSQRKYVSELIAFILYHDRGNGIAGITNDVPAAIINAIIYLKIHKYDFQTQAFLLITLYYARSSIEWDVLEDRCQTRMQELIQHATDEIKEKASEVCTQIQSVINTFVSWFKPASTRNTPSRGGGHAISTSTGHIVLTVPELLLQSGEMESLQDEYANLFQSLTACLNSANSHWSPLLAMNFSFKIQLAKQSFNRLESDLASGAAAAKRCAMTFDAIDSAIAQQLTGG